MKIKSGALVREQNENDVDDSAFDTSEYAHMMGKLSPANKYVDLSQFIIDGKLQRHPQTKFINDISSDQAHMYFLATGRFKESLIPGSFWAQNWPDTTNGNPVSVGFFAAFTGKRWLSNLSLLLQIILFWIPFRFSDSGDPSFRLGPIKLDIGYKHWCGDYRLFTQSLYYAPWWIKYLVSKKTLKKMTRYYWEPEPNIDWLIAIDDRYIDECL